MLLYIVVFVLAVANLSVKCYYQLRLTL